MLKLSYESCHSKANMYKGLLIIREGDMVVCEKELSDSEAKNEKMCQRVGACSG